MKLSLLAILSVAMMPLLCHAAGGSIVSGGLKATFSTALSS